MSEGDLVIDKLNAFNNVNSQLFSMDIKIIKEHKCINMLCYFLDSWDILVVAIGNNNATLNINDLATSLLLEEMRQKNMEGLTNNTLMVRG